MPNAVNAFERLHREAVSCIEYTLKFHGMESSAFDVDGIAYRMARYCAEDSIPVDGLDMLDDDLVWRLIEQGIED